MNTRNAIIVLHVLITVWASGCAKPQIVHPFSANFSDREFIVIEGVTRDHVGVLYMGHQEQEKNGKLLPVRWAQTPVLLVPVAQGVNPAEEKDINQTRQAVELIRTSATLSAAAIVNLKAETESAFKYESKATKFYYLKPSTGIYFNPKALEYISEKLKADPTYRFAFISGLYEGTAFAETYTKINTGGKLSFEAAFQIDGLYYVDNKGGIINDGSIIFQLTEFDPKLIGTNAPSIERTMKPLSNEQIRSLLPSIKPLFRDSLPSLP